MMVRRTTIRRRRLRVYGRRGRSVKQRSTDILSNRYVQGAAYGLIRPKIANATRNFFSQLPIVGDLAAKYGDEVSLLGAAIATDKLVKNDRVKSFARKVEFSETARILEQIDVGGLLNSIGGNSNSQTSNANTNDNNGF